MCGIAGIIRARGAPWTEVERARADRAMARLARRGPDGGGAEWSDDGRWVLMHRRLATQDLSESAAQPMVSADGALTITYNGEIYNAPAMRRELEKAGRRFRTRSDTEVLVEALRAWGLERTLEEVCGMFAFAAVERVVGEHGKTRVMAAVDAVGMKPLAWAMQSSGADERSGPSLVVGSDCDAVRELMGERAGIDPVSMGLVLSVGYCPSPRTMWRGVSKLPAGCAMEWTGDEAGPRVWRYWRPPAGIVAERPLEEFEGLLGRVTNEHLIGDVPVGMFLSAGLDSASVALALKRGGAEMGAVTAYTLCAGGTGSAEDETAGAADLAARLGMRHRAIGFTAGDLASAVHEAGRVMDEPQGYTAVLTMGRIARAVRASEPGLKVMLSGDGADEALGGYAWHRDGAEHPLSLGAFSAPSAADRTEHATMAAGATSPRAGARERLGALHALGRMSFACRYLVRTFGGFHPAEAGTLLAVEGVEKGFAEWLEAEDASSAVMPRRAQRLDVLGLCAGSILPKVDRACMDVGLEVRSPFLDRRMLEWGLTRAVDPREHEMAGAKGPIRAMLARGVEAGLVDKGVLSRPKQGFSLRIDGREYEALAGMIEDSALVRDGVLRPDWCAFVTDDPEMRRARLFVLGMAGAWYAARK